MKIERLIIRRFRGIRDATLFFPAHGVLIGDNNTGKSTVLEALDLVLGPDRLRGFSVIDEHDFCRGEYLPVAAETGGTDEPEDTELTEGMAVAVEDEVVVVEADGTDQVEPLLAEATGGAEEDPEIYIEATITGLNDEQLAHFKDAIEFWNLKDAQIVSSGNLDEVDAEEVVPTIRVSFSGRYDPDDDDFVCSTFFTKSNEDGQTDHFTKRDKQKCGFLYLRTLRTGSRALSLERGSLLDVILRIKELRPNLWEQTLDELRSFVVAEEPELGITGVLTSISNALQKYVPNEWGNQPQLRVSSLTRDHLRRVITAFIATGEDGHLAPFYMQGTGTINMLVLAMLSQIAADKQNVIFAMEEPEIAIPPYAQKQIVGELRSLSTQSLLTSHSPYVLEEFEIDQTMILARDQAGSLEQKQVSLPPSVKPKWYRNEFRTRFCEGLLSRRILIAEGATEASCVPVAARRLAELDPSLYKSIESLGICVIDAGTDSRIKDLAEMYRELGKEVFACCDKQSDESEAAIRGEVTELFMHQEKGIEDLVLSQTTEAALVRHSDNIDWPSDILQNHDPKQDPKAAFRVYFIRNKPWAISDFLVQCEVDEIPEWLKDMVVRLKGFVVPEPAEHGSD